MDDLTTWLLEQVTVDERDAAQMRHLTFDSEYYSCPGSRTGPVGDLEYGEDACDCGMPQQRARLLADCEAKRKLVALHRPVNVTIGGDIGGESIQQPGVVCWHCIGPAWQQHDLSWVDVGEAVHWPCLHLRLLAEPYAKLGRPGYQESWRPA